MHFFVLLLLTVSAVAATPGWEKPQPLSPLFRQEKELRLPIQSGYADHEIQFDIPPGAIDRLVIQFDTYLQTARGSGSSYTLGLKLNGRYLPALTATGQLRLMNRGDSIPDVKGYYGQRPWTTLFQYPQTMVYFAPQANAVDRRAAGTAGIRYVFEITDAVQPGSNRLSIVNSFTAGKNQGLPAPVTAMVLENLTIGVLPANAPRRAAAPPVLSRDAKWRDLCRKINWDLPALAEVRTLAHAPGQEKAAQAALLAYFRNRPQPTLPEFERQKGQKQSTQDRRYAEEALRNYVKIFYVFGSFELGEPIDFQHNLHPKLDPEWLNHLNRLWFMTHGARAYRETGDSRFATAWLRQIRDWCRQGEANFFPISEAQWSTLSTGIRLRTWLDLFLTYVKNPEFTPDDLVDQLFQLERHADMLRAIGLPPGNWGLMCANGMGGAGIVFPEFTAAPLWKQTAADFIRREFDRQILPDGMHYELDWGYHTGCFEWFSDLREIARLNGDRQTAETCGDPQRMQKLYEIVALCIHPDGGAAPFGDVRHDANYRYVATRGARLFPQNATLQALAGNRNFALPPTINLFPASGYVSIRSNWTPEAMHMLLKSGPNGGWHCHPDNNAFELYAGKRKFIADPGCYTYNWADGRQDFLYTKVHPTLTLDDRDSQFKPLPPLRVADSPRLQGVRLGNVSYPGVTHWRTALLVDNRFFVLLDEAVGPACGTIAVRYPLLPGDIRQESATPLTARTNFATGTNLLLTATAAIPLQLDIEEGFMAPKYNEKVPRGIVRYSAPHDGQTDFRIATLLLPYSGAAPQTSLHYPAPDRLEIRIGDQITRLERTGQKWRLLP